jgi:hypothetical protein
LQNLIKKTLFEALFHSLRTVQGYNNRQFNRPQITKKYSPKVAGFQHIKKPQYFDYLIFDIDNITPQAFNNLFYNNFSLLPNFYICEYSNKKQCYTLQAFFLLSEQYKTDKEHIELYKKLCLFFGADLNYQLKTGIHKNPIYENYKVINQETTEIKLFKNDYLGLIHFDRFNLANFKNAVYNLELFNELPLLEPFNEPISKKNSTAKANTPEAKQKPKNPIKTPLNTLDNLMAEPATIKEGQRNIFIFDKVRHFAYFSNNKTFKNILDYAKRINSSLKNPIPEGELKATAKSIFNYVNQVKLTGKYSEVDRQKSQETRHRKALIKVEEAIKQLTAKNKGITPSAIRKITGQQIATIKLLINEVLNSEKVAENAPLTPALCKTPKQQINPTKSPKNTPDFPIICIIDKSFSPNLKDQKP